MTKKTDMKNKNNMDLLTAHINGVAGFLAGLIYTLAVLGAIFLDSLNVPDLWTGLYVLLLALLGTYILMGLKIASQWEKAVILRFGKFRHLAGPGMFWIIPVVDTIANWIDHRGHGHPLQR